MRTIFTSTLALFTLVSSAQNMGAFNDKFGYFQVFDNGIKVKVEQLPAEDFVVGGNAVGYLDNMSNFNIYYDGKSVEVADQAYTSMRSSQNLLAFNMGTLLYVFDHGRVEKLSNWSENWDFIGEDIVAYYDEFQREFRLYYDGFIYSVFNDLGSLDMEPIDLGGCLISFVDPDNYLSTVFEGELFQLRHQQDVLQTIASRNVVGVSSQLSPAFSVFHNGNYFELESAFPPISFKPGIDMCAYVDYMGEFKVYYNNDLQTVTSYEPDFYEIVDSVMVFSEQGFFKAWYNGEVTVLENFVPETYQMDNGSIAYLDQQNRLKLFQRGEVIEVTQEIVKGFRLNGNVITYNVGLNNVEIFYMNLKFE